MPAQHITPSQQEEVSSTKTTARRQYSTHTTQALLSGIFSPKDMDLLLRALKKDSTNIKKEDREAYDNINSWIASMKQKHGYVGNNNYLSHKEIQYKEKVVGYKKENQENDDHYFNDFIEWIMLAYFEHIAKEKSDFNKIFKTTALDDIGNGCDYIVESKNQKTGKIWWSAIDLGNIAKITGFVGKSVITPSATPTDFFSYKKMEAQTIPKSVWLMEPHFSYALVNECLQSIMQGDSLDEALEENFEYALESKELKKAQKQICNSLTEVPKTIENFSLQIKSILLNGCASKKLEPLEGKSPDKVAPPKKKNTPSLSGPVHIITPAQMDNMPDMYM